MSAADLELQTESEPEGAYHLANLYPRETGLPMTIWAGPRMGARHDVRVKVCIAHGDRMDLDNIAVVGVRPEPRLIHGELPRRDLALVSGWVRLNEAALVGLWEGRLGSIEFAQALQRV